VILKELSEAVGVSGKEDAVRKVILKAIEGHADDIRIDALGSITAIKRGTGANPLRVMLASHMDEVGFMVTGFDGDGLIRFTSVGGLDDRILPGLRVKVGDNLIPGCIIWTPIHVNREQNVVKLKNLRIDIGANNKDNAAGQVKPGDRIAFDTQFAEAGDKMLRGKAFDDRAGCSVLVDVLSGGPYAADVLAAFTVQEEIGLRGAQVAAQALNPDVALVLEGAPAHDLPNPLEDPDDEEEWNPSCVLGNGPVLTVMDRSMIVNPRLLNFLRETADSNGIPYQLKTQLGGGTDGGSIHVANGGTTTAVISVPCRYIHSPTAYLHRDDYDNALRLVQAALNGITADVLTAQASPNGKLKVR
jgi:tetrahedral aminopeptidase